VQNFAGPSRFGSNPMGTPKNGGQGRKELCHRQSLSHHLHQRAMIFGIDNTCVGLGRPVVLRVRKDGNNIRFWAILLEVLG